jgi:ParB-like chromosome segregation protein Spo0J
MAAPHPIEIEHVPVDSLRPDPANPRKISEAELEALTRSVRQFGLIDPLIALRDGTVIAGHQRLVAARRLGFKTVPVVYVDLPLEQARLLNLALNKISGEWDEELLARLLADLSADAADLSLSGFDDDELKKLLRSLDHREKRERPEAFDVDAAFEAAQGTHRAKRGDLWALGEHHRVLLGDATDAADVARLLDGKRAAMAFTDPPYNVAYGDHGGQQRGARKRRIKNDALTPADFEAFCRAWGKNLFDSVDGGAYVCMSSREWPTVSRVLAELGGHWSDTIVWAKDRFVLGRADFQRQYEPIWYGWREGTKRCWRGGRDQSDVWQIARPSVSDAAPIMKPLEFGRARTAQQQPRGRHRSGLLPRIGNNADRGGAHRPRVLRTGAGPAVCFDRRRSLGKLQRRKGDEALMIGPSLWQSCAWPAKEIPLIFSICRPHWLTSSGFRVTYGRNQRKGVLDEHRRQEREAGDRAGSAVQEARPPLRSGQGRGGEGSLPGQREGVREPVRSGLGRHGRNSLQWLAVVVDRGRRDQEAGEGREAQGGAQDQGSGQAEGQSDEGAQGRGRRQRRARDAGRKASELRRLWSGVPELARGRRPHAGRALLGGGRGLRRTLNPSANAHQAAGPTRPAASLCEISNGMFIGNAY